MRKGQGSLEYLLILAAILAIAVVVVVVANSLLSSPQQQTKIGEDKYACSLQGIELVAYTTSGDTSGGVKFGSAACTKLDAVPTTNVAAKCTVHNADASPKTITIQQATGATTCNYFAG